MLGSIRRVWWSCLLLRNGAHDLWGPDVHGQHRGAVECPEQHERRPDLRQVRARGFTRWSGHDVRYAPRRYLLCRRITMPTDRPPVPDGWPLVLLHVRVRRFVMVLPAHVAGWIHLCATRVSAGGRLAADAAGYMPVVGSTCPEASSRTSRTPPCGRDRRAAAVGARRRQVHVPSWPRICKTCRACSGPPSTRARSSPWSAHGDSPSR